MTKSQHKNAGVLELQCTPAIRAAGQVCSMVENVDLKNVTLRIQGTPPGTRCELQRDLPVERGWT
jgi:hypothetical protein